MPSNPSQFSKDKPRNKNPATETKGIKRRISGRPRTAMKPNSKLYRGTTSIPVFAYDSSLTKYKNYSLEFYRTDPTLKTAYELPFMVWNGGDEVNFYYTTKKPVCKKWRLEISSIIHEPLEPNEQPHFKAPISLSKFRVIKSY